jgi:hypothetical protein
MIFILFHGFFIRCPFTGANHDIYIVSRLICRDAIKTGGRKTARWVIWSFFLHSSFGSGALKFWNRSQCFLTDAHLSLKCCENSEF